MEKKDIYQKFGIKEYWIVDPQKEWIEIYNLKDNSYNLLSRVEGKGKIKSTHLRKFDLEFSKLFREI